MAAQFESLRCAFRAAVEQGFQVTIELDANHGSEDNRATLFRIRFDFEALKELIINFGADTQDFDSGIVTSFLNLACNHNHPTMLSFLLDHGANINMLDNNLETPLSRAIRFHQTAIARRLVFRGAHIQPPDHLNLFWMACQDGDLQLFEHIKHEINLNDGLVDIINIKNKDGMTPLIIACKNEKAALVELLLSTYGAAIGVNDFDHRGNTALLHACDTLTSTCVEILIRYCDNISFNQQNNNGTTALMRCAARRHGFSSFTLLMNRASVIDYNIQDNDGRNALILACAVGNGKVANYLLSLRHSNEESLVVDIHAADNNKKTALFYACENHMFHVMEILLANGANINKQDNKNMTVLMHACSGGDVDLTKFLLNHQTSGCLLNGALIHACSSGNAIIVSMLLNHEFFASGSNLSEVQCTYQKLWSWVLFDHSVYIYHTSEMQFIQWLLILHSFLKSKLFIDHDVEIYKTGSILECPKLISMINLIRNSDSAETAMKSKLYSDILYRIWLEEKYGDRNMFCDDADALNQVLIRFEYNGFELGSKYLSLFTTIQVNLYLY